MDMEAMLRQENYQLKNEITDLKNAFDLNRDILKILSNYKDKLDPQNNLLMQIITRLTSVNNQAMLTSLELIQQKNVLKQENLRLNIDIALLEDKLSCELENNRISNSPTESKLVMQEQFNSLNRELLAANEERISKEQEIEYWKQKWQSQGEAGERSGATLSQSTYQTTTRNAKIKRKYESKEAFRLSVLLRESEKERRRLGRYVEELENRLLLFIKAFNIAEDSLQGREGREREELFAAEREEVRLLKYALNDISVEKKDNQYILTITERYKAKDKMNNVYLKERRSLSWPRNTPRPEDSDPDNEGKTHLQEEARRGSRMSENQY